MALVWKRIKRENEDFVQPRLSKNISNTKGENVRGLCVLIRDFMVNQIGEKEYSLSDAEQDLLSDPSFAVDIAQRQKWIEEEMERQGKI